jgi:uncharacterized protein YcfL
LKKLALLIIVLVFLAGCGSGNNTDDINLSESRIVEMARLRWEIEQVDIEISKLARSSAPNAEINRLESGREVLLKKVMALQEIEQKYQSKK